MVFARTRPGHGSLAVGDDPDEPAPCSARQRLAQPQAARLLKLLRTRTTESWSEAASFKFEPGTECGLSDQRVPGGPLPVICSSGTLACASPGPVRIAPRDPDSESEFCLHVCQWHSHRAMFPWCPTWATSESESQRPHLLSNAALRRQCQWHWRRDPPPCRAPGPGSAATCQPQCDDSLPVKFKLNFKRPAS